MRRFREALARCAGVAVALGLLLALALPAIASADVRLQKVGDFDAPVHLAGAPGDGERLYVVQQDGIVKVTRGGVASTFLDLGATVEYAGEQGLLSIAFPPDFQTSRLFYVYYTERGGASNVLAELRAPSGDAADPASRRTVLAIPHPGASNHNGGQLQFGPDGLLYLAPGDGANGANARRLDTLLGKLLRIDPRRTATSAYSVPADNPYAAGQGGARPEIWARGLRNPFRFSFDRATGALILGDVGEGTTEEIDLLPAVAGGAGRDADFGWNVCEGSFATGSRTTLCTLPNAVRPAIDRFRGDGFRSIIPGYVVRDPSLPSLHGRLVYGDYFVPQLRSAQPTLPSASDDRPAGVSVPSLTSFGEDAGGCLYATSAAGPVYRLVEQDARIPCPPPAGTEPPPPTGPEPPGGRPGARQPGGGQAGGRNGGGGGQSGGGAGGGAGPVVHVSVPARQRVLRLGGVVLHVRCQTACRLTAGGTLRIARGAHPLRRLVRGVPASRRVRVLVRLRRRGRTALRRALRNDRHPKVAVVLRARDDGGASSLKRATVRVTR